MSGMDSDLLTDNDSKQLDLLKDEDFMCMSPDDVALAFDANVHPDKGCAIGAGLGGLGNSCGSVITAVDEFPSIDSSWDQDVLLSNAVLPEANPLLELDHSIEEDFQQVLDEWETHIGSLQTPGSVMSVDETSMDNEEPGHESSVSSCHEPIATDGDGFFDTMDIKPTLAGGNANLNTTSVYQQPLLSTTSSLDSALAESVSSGSNDSYPTVATPPPVPLSVMSAVEDERSMSPGCNRSSTPLPKLGSKLVSTDGSGTNKQPRLTLGKKTLAGIVISSGPGGHFETYEVIEASDVDNLLDQFEAVDRLRRDLNANGNTDPKRASQIVAAVQSHFSGSNRNFPPGKVPKIVASQRIKDSLPLEIVEKIKSSSQRSKTIAIIEPVQKNATNSSFKSTNSGQSNSPARTANNLPGKGGIASRFHEAALSMNRSKYRHFGISGGHPPTPQQVQVSLDHDYCSSNKSRRNNRAPNHHSTSIPRLAGHSPIASAGDGRHRVFISAGSKVINHPSGSMVSLQQSKAIIRVSRAPVLKRARDMNAPQIVSLAKPSGSGTTSGSLNPMQISSPISMTPASIHNSSSQLTCGSSSSSLITLVHTTPKELSPVKLEPPPSPASSSSTFNHDPDIHDDSSAPSPLSTQRRDSDPKKDSGLESGDVSDASNNEDEHLYSRLPPYLTTLPTKSANCMSQPIPVSEDQIKKEDMEDMEEEEQGHHQLYDRLPTYVTGLSREHTPDTVLMPCSKSETDNSMDIKSGTNLFDDVNVSFEGLDHKHLGGKCDTGSKFKLRRSTRQRSRSSCRSSRSSSGSRSSSASNSTRGSSDSECSPSRDESPMKIKPPGVSLSTFHVVTRSSTAAKKSKKLQRSPSLMAMKSGANAKRHRRDRSTSSTSSSSSRFRSRSPLPSGELSTTPRRMSKRNRSFVHNSSMALGSNLVDMDQYRRDEKKKQIEERRVVYVGRICESTSRASLRTRFEAFGPIEEISVHFRDRGDNYGFVTFKNKLDAYEAVEHGNDDPKETKVDLCFGGRRAFCKTKYSDLDSLNDKDSGGLDHVSLDFDSLLRQARAEIPK
eukprot:maker-scaffold561_size136864-snap-gene-0.19 protein:Tk09520 transcript:maker-scaffold561_size136864-snap-gene-0.19-mRNA-1 annotation:"PREDICTED: uncharacterized protein LOC100870622"